MPNIIRRAGYNCLEKIWTQILVIDYFNGTVLGILTHCVDELHAFPADLVMEHRLQEEQVGGAGWQPGDVV